MAVKWKTIHNLVWQKFVLTYGRDINKFPKICLKNTSDLKVRRSYRRVYTVVLGLVTGYHGLVTLLLQLAPGLVPIFSNCTPPNTYKSLISAIVQILGC